MQDKPSRHHLNKGLIECLRIFQRSGGPRKIQDLFMPNLSHVTNSVKLKHWSFIARVADPKSHWRITKKGEDFLFGKISALKTAITRNDQVLGFEGKTLNVFQVSGHYETPEKHIYEDKQADGQSTLF